jgi:hypothetical protein
MFVLDALFDHIRQISSNVEIIGSLVQFAQFRQLMSELGQTRKCGRATGRSALPERPDIVSQACNVPKVPGSGGSGWIRQ